MIYQPRNVQPSSSAIDASVQNSFSMEIQTSSYVTAYKLTIVDFDNNNVYIGSKVTLDTPVYNGEKLAISVPDSSGMQNGVNYKWRVRLYQSTSDIMIAYSRTVAESTETQIYVQANNNIRVGMNIRIGAQIREISAYNSSDGIVTVSEAFDFGGSLITGSQYYIFSNFIETTPDYIVYARALPEVSIGGVPTVLTLKYHTFNGSYSQPDGVPIVYHQFELYVMDGDGNLEEVDNSGKVYSAKLDYTYDGFRTGNRYFIRMTIENDMGVVSQTEMYHFDVNYEIIEYLQQPVATFDDKHDAIKISWVTPVEHDATPISLSGGDVGFKYLYNTPYSPVNSLYTDGYIAEWHSDDGLYVIPEEFNISMQFSPDNSFYYDDDGVYTAIRPIVEADSESQIEENSFRIYLDDKSILYLTPYISNNQLVTTETISIPSSESNPKLHIYIKDNINFTEHPYIRFEDRDYVEKVVAYNSSTKMATLQRELNFVPSVGEKIIINNSISKELYSNTADVFVLTSTGVAQMNDDYVWNDTSSWNDSYIWTEGGSAIERVCGHWWKIKIDNNSIQTEEVYISG